MDPARPSIRQPPDSDHPMEPGATTGTSASEAPEPILRPARPFLKMVSEQKRQGWPQNVWAVDDEGVVYEAQLSNSETGEYHGYPMKVGDGFTIFVAREWEKRGT